MKTFSNPFDPRRTRSLSLFNATQRFVVSYYYELPIRKFNGVAGQILNGWAVSGITEFQSGFPIHLQSFDDNELTSSIDFSSGRRARPAGQVQEARSAQESQQLWIRSQQLHLECFATIPRCRARRRSHSTASSRHYSDATGTAPRSICCGPGLNNWDLSVQKSFTDFRSIAGGIPLGHIQRLQSHQFFNPDGNCLTGRTSGESQAAGDPRLMQVALKFYF